MGRFECWLGSWYSVSICLLPKIATADPYAGNRNATIKVKSKTLSAVYMGFIL
jgi:hypothetical protein